MSDNTPRSHSEIIRDMGRDVPPHAQDYHSQEYLDWLETIPEANAANAAPKPSPVSEDELKQVVVVNDYLVRVQVIRKVWKLW